MKKASEYHKEWITYAEEDLAMANVALSTRPELIRSICFHAQQTAEKYIKALLIFKGVNFPKIHDLSALADILADPEFPVLYDQLDRLSRFAVASRYPEDSTILEHEDSLEAIQIAEAVKQYVLSKIVM